MKRISTTILSAFLSRYHTRNLLLVVALGFFSWAGYAQPAFNTLVVNGTNTQATLTFTASSNQVAGNNAGNQNLVPGDFTVTISASAAGGSVSAGSVTVTVAHTAPALTATLSFTIPNASTADGSEVLTIKPSGANKIFDVGTNNAMAGTETITANLKDLLAPVFSSTAPATGSSVSTTSVSYTLSEALASGSITWLGTAGPDNGNSHAQTLSASERTSGAHSGVLSSPPTLLNGSTYQITFAGSDAASNAATAVVKTGVIFDTSPPAAPSTPAFSSADDTGSSNSDGITKNTTNLTFTGTAEAGSSVQLYDGSTPVGSPATATGGNYSIDLNLSAGTYSINAKATDAANNTSVASGNTPITVDTTPPSQPAAPDLTAGTDLGSSSTDNITSDNTPDFTGSGTNGNTITVTSDVSGVVGTGTVSGGAYTITVSTLPDGAHNMTVIETDVAGNSSIASSALGITIDTTPPAAPTVPDLATASDSGSSSTDDNTNDNTPTFSVTGTAGLKLEILDGATVVATAASATGSAQNLTASALADGVKSITARTTDVAGNTASSAALSVTIDTTPPATPPTPDLTAATDTGSSSTDDNTSNTTPDFSVTGTSGFLLEVLRGGSTVIASTASATGAAQTLTSVSLADGSYSITARSTDIAGNTATSSALNPVVIDTTPPAKPGVPDLTAGTDLGSSSTDNITSDNTPDFTGSGTNGSTITVTSDVSGVVGTGTVSGGTYTITVSTLPDGAHNITVVETDLAGNSSVASNALAITIDTAPPAAPTVPDLATASDSGSSSTDDNTNDNTPTFSVTGTAGLKLEILDGATVVATAASATGSAQNLTASALSDGVKSITARTSDVAGNTASSAALSVTIDTTPPATPPTPDLTAASDSGSSSTDNNTNDNTPDFSVTGTSGFLLEVLRGGSTVIASTASATGAAQTLTSVSLADGSYSITARSTDVAGNTATSTALNPVVIDTTPPGAPGTPDLTSGTDSGVSNTDNITNNLTPSFTIGTVTSGNTVNIISSVNGAIGSGVAAGTSITVASSVSLTQGNGQTHSITATQTDPAGNTGVASSGLTITVDATAPTITSATFSGSFVHTSDPDYTTCSATSISNDSNREYVHLVMSEALGLTNGTVPTIQTASTGTIGFNAANYSGSWGGSNFQTFSGCSNRGGCAYHTNGTNFVIHLQDVFITGSTDGLWTTSTTFSFTSGGTNIKDVAGNELGSVATIVPGATAPVLASSMLFNPNGAGNEIITFTVDQALNTSTAANAVTGITVDADGPGPGAAVSVAGTYSTTGNTITLNSSSNNQWSTVTTVSYSVLGNLAGATGVAMGAFTSEPILLGPVTIASNSPLNTALAKQGETITITFTANSALLANPTATIGGLTATVSGSFPNYTASVVTDGTVPNTVVAFDINATQSGRSTDVTITSDGSSVTYDNVAPATPTAPDLASASDSNVNTDDVTNINTNLVFQGANGTVENNAQVQVFDNTTLLGTATATATGSWTYTHLGTLADGVHPINIKARDAAGNLSSASSNLNITVDTTLPVAASIAVSSTLKGIGTTNGIVATSVDFLVTFTETNTPLSGIDATDFTVSQTGSVNNTGLSVAVTSATTRTVTVNGITGTGKISLGLNNNGTILDLAGNSLSAGISTSFTGSQYYSIVLPAPTANSFTPTASNITGNSVTLTWPSPVLAQTPTHFLVLAKTTIAGSYPAVADGTPVSDGALAQNVTRVSTTSTFTFTGLNSGTSYDFIVYPYTLSSNNSSDNIDFETTSPGSLLGITTSTASTSWILLNSTAAPISSTSTSSGTSTAVMQFKVFDDGLAPISPNVMTLHLNGSSQETVTFNLTEDLTAADGASISGFTSSTGSVVSAVYSGKGSTNTITLTSNADGAWSSATTISYSATTGNAQLVTLGKMQSIFAHAITSVSDVSTTYNTPGSFTFNVPAGVTSITVETWGGGGSAGGFDSYYGGASQGGGGGAYSRSLLSVSPLASYSVNVGAGGPAVTTVTVDGVTAPFCCIAGNTGGTTSFSGPAGTVSAVGGQGGASSAFYAFDGTSFVSGNGSGGASTSGIGDVRFSGGNGGNGGGNNTGGGWVAFMPNNIGGSGGSSAGSSSNGFNGQGGFTGSCIGCTWGGVGAPAGGGAGGSGTEGNNGNNGAFPGGGGGGTDVAVNGAGANGQVKITYSAPSGAVGTSDFAGDNSPFKFNKLVVTQGTGTSTALQNIWSSVIAGAELSDGVNTPFNSVNNPSDVIIGTNSITFQNIPATSSSDVGYVTDATASTSSKTYTVKIWLKTNLPDALAAQIDGLNLAFNFDASTNLTYDDITNSGQKSSRLATPEPSITSGSCPIQVVASQLVYHSPGSIAPTNTNPQAQIGVNVPFSLSNVQVPEVYALDANNNLDLDYEIANGNTGTITNSLGFTQSVSSMTFTNGKLSLSPFYFTSGSATSSNTQIIVTGSGSPSVTPATSTNVWPVISSLSTITAGATAEPSSFPSLTTALSGATVPQTNAVQNFDFTVTDDAGANLSTFADNDQLATRINSITIRQNTNNGTATGGAIFDNWQNSIAGASLSLGGTVVPATVTINSNSITFSNIPNNPDVNAYVASSGSNALEVVNVATPTAPVHRGNLLNGAGGANLLLPRSVTVSGSYAYVGSVNGNALEIVDVSNPAVPVHKGLLANGGPALLLSPTSVAVLGNYAYVTSQGSNALEIIDISNPSAPVHAGSLVNGSGGALLSSPQGIAVRGNYAYIASNGSSALEIVNVSTPAVPAHVGSVSITGAFSVVLVGDYAYVTSFSGAQMGLVIVNISNPASPVVVGSLANGAGGALLSNPRSVTVSGNYAYVAAQSSNALEIIDVSNPAAPVHAGSLSNGVGGALLTTPLQVKVFGNYAYVSSFGSNALEIVDVSNPTAPVHAGSLLNGTASLAGPFAAFVSNSTSGQEGFIPDGQSKTYSLKIWLKNPVDPTLQDLIDNEDFVFEVNSETDFGITSVPGNVSSTIATVTPFNSGDSNNKVDVTATQIDFTTPVNASQFYDAALTPSPIAKARDANKNLDADWSTGNGRSGSVATANPATYPLANSAVTLTNGVFTFNPTLQVTSGGSGLDNTTTNLVLTSGTLTGGIGNTFTLNYSKGSDIVKDGSFIHSGSAGNTYTQNILYANYQAATFASSTNPSTIGVALERFQIRDGGATHSDADGTATKLQTITLNITNGQYLRTVALYNGTTEIAEVPVVTPFYNSATGDLTFSSLLTPFSTPVNGDGFLTVYATFNATGIVDNQVIQVKVANVTSVSASSFFATAGTSTSFAALGTDDNKLEVVATTLDVTTPATAANASLSSDFPGGGAQVTVEARDTNQNRDLDFQGKITAFTKATPADSTINRPTIGVSSFTNGVYQFPSNFQFITGTNGDIVTLKLRADNTGGSSGINCGVNAICTGISPTITLQTSFESFLTGDPTFTPPARISYIQHLDSASISGSSYELIRGLLVDGSRSSQYKYHGVKIKGDSTNQDATVNYDIDGAATVLTGITLRVYSAASLSRIALFDSAGVMQGPAFNVSNLHIPRSTPYHDFTWSGLTLTAKDNSQAPLSIRVTFKSDSAHIHDLDLLQVQLIAATVGTGSQFWNAAGTVGGQHPSATPSNVGAVDVIASKFDFIKQPPAYAGINQPVPLPPSPPAVPVEVWARDQYNIVDTEWDISDPSRTFTVTTPGATVSPSVPFAFSKGVLKMAQQLTPTTFLPTLQYSTTGDGTLTVTNTGNTITSNLNQPGGTATLPGIPNVAITSTSVKVMHVTATLNNTALPVSFNLKGGATGQVLFGVDFVASGVDAPNNQPVLNEFKFSFNEAFETTNINTTVLKNVKVLQSTNGLLSGAKELKANGIGTYSNISSPAMPAGSHDQVWVQLNSSTIDLSTSTKYTYFLVADISTTASNQTLPLSPSLDDGGFGTLTDGNIIVSKGSSVAAVNTDPSAPSFIKYSFASTRPPSLVWSDPAKGQLNVDPALDTIRMHFDVKVWSLDGKAYLYDSLNNYVATLDAANGRYASGDPVADTLKFKVNFISPYTPKQNSLYYVLIAQGDANNKLGISDNSFNTFGGISSPGTLYFKTSNPSPPKMMGTDATRYYITPTGASINAAFDQPGKAYYLVTNHIASPIPPTVGEINGTTTYSGNAGAFVASDVIQINQITLSASNPSFQFGTFSAVLAAGSTYDVWMYAENDAKPNPFATAAAYGSVATNFAVGAAGPTFTISVPTVPTYTYPTPPSPADTYVNMPSYQVCPDSHTTLQDPIIIAESSVGQWKNTTGTQSINFILPTGYTFDVTPDVTLTGSDFVSTSLVASLVNNSTFNIKFTNNGAGSLDNITISNIKIFAQSRADAGTQIIRLGGNAVTSIPDFSPVATINQTQGVLNYFTNTYSIANDSIFKAINAIDPINNKAVRAIPDNFTAPGSYNLAPFTARLIPVTTGDYGPNTFSGSSITTDVLSLSGAPKDAAFNITMTHTDFNGCVTNITDQYVVYDHTKAIPRLQTSYCLSPNYSLSDSTSFNGKVGYYLSNMYASIPFNGTVLTNDSVKWVNLVKNIPIQSSYTGNAPYYTFFWDFKPLLDNLNNGSINGAHTPGSQSISGVTLPVQTFYKGGSLGVVEFTGKYVSQADQSLILPFKQQVELFAEAKPAVEVSGWSSQSGPTFVFCEHGGNITLNGYPAGAVGQSTASFALYDSAAYATALANNTALPSPLVATGKFTDAGSSNGSASLQPSFTNNYGAIRVVYTYADNNQPCSSSGYLHIKITPNPVAAFTATSVGPNAAQLGSYCVGNPIDFVVTPWSSGTATIKSYSWNFGDANALGNSNTPSGLGGQNIFATDPLAVQPGVDQTKTYDAPQHIFGLSTTYAMSLSLTSNYGCPSIYTDASNQIIVGPVPQSFAIGDIPAADFKFLGNCLRDTISFLDNSKIPAGNSSITNWSWDFGQGTGTSTLQNPIKIYNGIPSGIDTVKLVATTTITFNSQTFPGCSGRVAQTIMLLDTSIITSSHAYSRDFSADDGGWKAISLSTQTPSSWAWGDASNKLTQDLFTANSSKMWMTAPDSSYTTNEQSALYTGCLNLSGLLRPMISLNSYTNLQSGDGVVLQYSTDSLNVIDPNKKWKVLGSFKNGISDGVGWYNAQSLATQPGGNKAGYGWSETGNDTVGDTLTYFASKHSLDEVYQQNGVGPSRVIFRFALASGHTSDYGYEGFAIDDVRIGSRTRTILLENFLTVDGGNATTNTVLGQDATFIDNFVSNTTGTQVVKINYHVGFGGLDPINTDDSDDQGARSLYYNVKKVPYSFMDGDRPSYAAADVFSKWGQTAYDLQSLKLARALININATSDNTTGKITISGKATAVDNSVKAGSVLHVAVLEPFVDGVVLPGVIQTGETYLANTLKKMLPSALGTRFPKALPKDSVINFGPFVWTPNNLRDRADNASLDVVVFLQDEMSREVYQAEIVSVPLPSVVTEIDPFSVDNIKLYPNPVDQELTIELPSPAKESTNLRLANQWGQYTELSAFLEGEQKKTISTSGLAEGVYILQIGGNNTAVRAKVVVVHK